MFFWTPELVGVKLLFPMRRLGGDKVDMSGMIGAPKVDTYGYENTCGLPYCCLGLALYFCSEVFYFLCFCACIASTISESGFEEVPGK